MMDLITGFHEQVVYPAMETLVKSTVGKSEENIKEELGAKIDAIVFL